MILINDFKKESVEMKALIKEACSEVIDSGWYVLGKQVEKFEAQWSKKCRVNYSIAVGNGMDAIEIGIRALGIGPGDEVITTAMTAFATILAITRAGATPVIADIDINTGLLSRESVIRCISSKTKAILLVHLYGQMRDMESWVDICRVTGIKLIEDCAQSHLANVDGRYGGVFGEFGAYSFYPTKNLGALGDAGIIVSTSSEISEKAKSLRNYGQSDRYNHPLLGMNSRLDEIQAAILNVKLKWLDSFTQRRVEIADKYNNYINNKKINKLEPPQTKESHVYHLFVVKTEKRKQFSEYLKNNNIQSLIHYPVAAHMQKCLFDVKRDPKGLLSSEKFGDECITIPCNPQLTNDEVTKIIEVINKY
jgi:dTDP-4-amino-4,6-dideoxygalactose transaminase